jgi:hypothetical protein
MNWSRSAAIWLGLVTAFPLLYLGGFIPLFFYLQDSPNPPAGPETEHLLYIVAGFAMATFFLVVLIYLFHVFACYRGSALRKAGWLLALVVAAPVAMVAYWVINLWRVAAPTQSGSGHGVQPPPI